MAQKGSCARRAGGRRLGKGWEDHDALCQGGSPRRRWEGRPSSRALAGRAHDLMNTRRLLIAVRGVPWWAWSAPLVVLYSAMLVIARGKPLHHDPDEAYYLSIAALLSRGVHLYTGVWDNKAPLFYYSQALAYVLAGWRGPFLLDIAWIAVACAGLGLLLHAVGVSRVNVVAGMVVYPILLTGGWYMVGGPVLPVIAPVALVAYLWVRGAPVLVGVALGVVPFLGPQYAAIYLGLLIGAIVGRPPARAAIGSAMARVVAGAVAGATLLLVVLALRGELGAYYRTMRANLAYPDRVLRLNGKGSGFVAHLRIAAASLFSGSARIWCVWIIVALFSAAVVGGSLSRRGRTDGGAWWLLVSLSCAGIVATLWTLGETALWSYHLEVIALPAVLMMCTIIAAVERAGLPRVGAWLVTAGACALCLFAAAGIVNNGRLPFSTSLTAWERHPKSATAVALDRAAASAFPSATEVTYARVGGRGDDGSAAFIEDRLVLVCPVYIQFYFSSNLTQAARCLESRRPDLIAVAPKFRKYRNREYVQLWDPFVARVLAFLHRDYSPAAADHGLIGVVHVWRLDPDDALVRARVERCPGTGCRVFVGHLARQLDRLAAHARHRHHRWRLIT